MKFPGDSSSTSLPDLWSSSGRLAESRVLGTLHRLRQATCHGEAWWLHHPRFYGFEYVGLRVKIGSMFHVGMVDTTYKHGWVLFFFLLGLPWFATVYPNLKRWPKHVTNMYKKSVVPKVLNFDLHLLEGKPNHIWRIWGKNGRTWENYNICCRWENYVQEWDIYGLL